MDDRSQKLLDFLERSGPRLYALLTRLTLREDIAEDLMQELFIKLGKSSALEKADNLDAYGRRCAINLAFDWRRKNMCDTLRLDEVREPATNEESPPAKLIEREQLEQALGAIGQLTGLCRDAFVMRYIEQQSCEEVAKQLGKEPHQVRALCSKAITRLRNLLSKQNGGMR